MTQVLSLQRRPRRWMLAAILTALLLVPLVLVWRGRAAASDPAGESIKFNHKKHLTAEIPCLFCHPGALNGPVASLPSLNKCIGCHQNVQIESEKGRADGAILFEHWEQGTPLRWIKTYDQPDFVYFSHRPHIAAGVNCENCHGDVSQMEVVHPAYRINMGFCLNCHQKQAADKQTRLRNCSTCHK